MAPAHPTYRTAMIYAVSLPSGVTTHYYAPDPATATAHAQALAAAHRSPVTPPRPCCSGAAQMLGGRDALGGPDNFDPLLLADADYRDGYRRARIAIVGTRGLSPREQVETLPF